MLNVNIIYPRVLLVVVVSVRLVCNSVVVLVVVRWMSLKSEAVLGNVIWKVISFLGWKLKKRLATRHLWLMIAHVLSVIIVVPLVVGKRKVVHVPNVVVRSTDNVYSVVRSLLVLISIVVVVVMTCLHMI